MCVFLNIERIDHTPLVLDTSTTQREFQTHTLLWGSVRGYAYFGGTHATKCELDFNERHTRKFIELVSNSFGQKQWFNLQTLVKVQIIDEIF